METTVFGDPMSFWRTMPKGMLLRSNWTATSIAEYDGPLSLDSYCTETGSDFHLPVPLDRFIDYGMWVQNRAAPARRPSCRRARRARPRGFRPHPERRVPARGPTGGRRGRHRGLRAPARGHRGAPVGARLAHVEHDDLGVFRDKTVLVVGGGQSALESAALMTESGADVEVAARADHLNWLHGGKYHRMLGKWSRLVYAPTDVGPMGLSRIVAVPDLFRRFPRALQEPMAYRAIRPAGAAWLRPRLEDVPIHVGTQVWSAEVVGDRLRVGLDDGSTRTVDHLLLGTGYRVDISRYPFLDPALAGAVQSVGGYPRLKVGMESSVSGLHFLGAPAAYSFGPIMRFVAGGWYGAESLTGAVTGRQARSRAGSPLPVSE